MNDVLRPLLKYINQADYLNLKAIKNQLPIEQNKSGPGEKALGILIHRLKFLNNLLTLIDASLDIENTLTNAFKLKIRISKDKRIVNDDHSEESVITLAHIYDSLDLIVLLKEFTDDPNNLVLLGEICLHVTRITIQT